MDSGALRPYALKAGEGWTYHYGVDFTVKAGELGRGRRLAVIEYTSGPGEEPPEHTHTTEDEIFYVLQGALTFRCGEHTFELDDGGFVFLPRGIPHGYTIRSGNARLLTVTSPTQEDAVGGWGGFVADSKPPASRAPHHPRSPDPSGGGAQAVSQPAVSTACIQRR